MNHKEINSALQLFHFSERAPGMVFWKPKGYQIYRQVESIIRQELEATEHTEIRTPLMAESTMWKKSGHIPKFKDNMFFSSIEAHDFAIKPMNCPLHIELFKSERRSYRELPVRFVEFGHCHRNETTGALNGLFRLRSFTQDDGHVFCSNDQVKCEVKAFVQALGRIYNRFGFDRHQIEVAISLRPEQRVGDDELWDRAESDLQTALDEMKVKYELLPGEGAFYGPKIEFALTDNLGRKWQCGTIQLDYFLAERMNASFINSEGKKEYPVILHRAILGSLERFIAILLEHYEGKLPRHLNPNSVSIITTHECDSLSAYARSIKLELSDQTGANLDAIVIDDSDETLSKKIKEHYSRKGNDLIIIGDKELENDEITLHREGAMDLNYFYTYYWDKLLRV